METIMTQHHPKYLLLYSQSSEVNIWSLYLFLTCSCEILALINHNFVGNKGQGQISKLVLQENKVRQIFRKTNISYLGNLIYYLGKFDVLCFLVTLVLRFALFSNRRLFVNHNLFCMCQIVLSKFRDLLF